MLIAVKIASAEKNQKNIYNVEWTSKCIYT